MPVTGDVRQISFEVHAETARAVWTWVVAGPVCGDYVALDFVNVPFLKT